MNQSAPRTFWIMAIGADRASVALQPLPTQSTGAPQADFHPEPDLGSTTAFRPSETIAARSGTDRTRPLDLYGAIGVKAVFARASPCLTGFRELLGPALISQGRCA